MSYSFSPPTNITPMGDGSSIDSSFLTPPLTPRNELDVPYRPPETDRTSLSMKKRKRTHRTKKETKHENQYQAKSRVLENLPISGSGNLFTNHANRSNSLSILPTATSDGSDFDPGHSPKQKARRLTLPSKSTPTSVVTPLGSKVKPATLTRQLESPAMITLRRATTNKKPKKVELTFFPEPKFGNEKSGVLSYMVSKFSRPETSIAAGQSRTGTSPTTRSARSVSVGSDCAHPAWTFPAATVCTEAFVVPSLARPGASTSSPSSRRCSTKYVTGDSSYEIIWDEDDSSTTRPESSRASPKVDRRPSLAVTKLEAQLAQDLLCTRRSSAPSRRSSSTSSQSSVNMFRDQVITPEKLNTHLPRLLRDIGLRNLPRSRGSGRGHKRDGNMTARESSRQVSMDDSQRLRTQSIDFFPPIQHWRSSNVKDHDRRVLASAPLSDDRSFRRSSAFHEPVRSRFGSLVGSSSHTRRRSSATANTERQRGQRNKKRHSITEGKATDRQMDDTDLTPLLRSPG